MKQHAPLKFVALLIIFCTAQWTTGQQHPSIWLSPDLYVVKITSHAWLHVSYLQVGDMKYPCNGLVVADSDRAVLIDSPVSDTLTELLIDHFSELGIRIESFVPTHWHIDCLGGITRIHARGIDSYATELTREECIDRNIELPKYVLAELDTIKTGSLLLQIFYPGPGHTRDNVVVYLEADKLLFGGCILKNQSARSLGNLTNADTEKWPDTVQNLVEQFAETLVIIPGHGDPGGTEILEHTLELLNVYNSESRRSE